MTNPPSAQLNFTDADLDFLMTSAAPDTEDTAQLKAAVRRDPELRGAMIGDERVFMRVMGDDEIFLKISPTLYFEVLLRQAVREIEATSHTLEHSGSQSIPVFDTPVVVEVLSRAGVVEYLAHMLASFTRIQSYVVPVRVPRGVRRRVRYNDMDIDSLIRFSATAEESQRFGFYKRIADVCLFVTGIFTGQTFATYRHPGAAQPHAPRHMRTRRSLEEYEIEGKRFYRLAGEHPTAETLELSGVFRLLREHFGAARKPLSLISTRYLHSRRDQVFGVGTT